MSNDSRDYLEDILGSIEQIEEYVGEIDITGFRASRLIQDGVIRNIEVIGEAIGRLPKAFLEAHPELPAHEAVSMRNFMIHQYDGIDLDVLWETVRHDLPQLKMDVSALLKQENGRHDGR